MKDSRRWHRSLAVFSSGTLLLLGGAILFVPLRDGTARLNRLSAYGEGYISRDEPLTESEHSVFGKAHVIRRRLLCRTESSPGRSLPLVMTVIDGTRNRHAVHDPVYCIRGAGWHIVETETLGKTARGSMCLVRVRRGDEHRELLYFYTNGNARYDSLFRCWQEATLRRITFGLSGEEPLLVIIETVPTAGKTSAPASLKSVLPTLAKIVAPL